MVGSYVFALGLWALWRFSLKKQMPGRSSSK